MSADSKRVISLASLPSGPNEVFLESSFFFRNEGKTLATLSEILTESVHQHQASNHGDSDPPPVVFESLGLLVKFGKTRVRIAEGQCLWALRNLLPEVPVPEIYGWATEGGFMILYMELVKGVTVEKAWPTMTADERAGFWKSVRDVVDNLRKLSQGPNDPFVGQINRAPLHEHALDTAKDPNPGPFATVKDFHHWLGITTSTGCEMHWPGYKPEEIPDGYRHLVPDDAGIIFTHADLYPTNIMVDTEKPAKIAAVIDWGESGWWPDYWEFYKALWTSERDSEWQGHLMKYLEEPDEDTMDGINGYIRSLGN